VSQDGAEICGVNKPYNINDEAAGRDFVRKSYEVQGVQQMKQKNGNLVEKKDMQDSFYCSAILGQDFVDGMR
jgi:hypothetical protein